MRFFGDYEKGADSFYPDVWKIDSLGATLSEKNVESVDSVANRVIELLTQIDKNASNRCFLLVAHGDVLQILQTVTTDTDPAKHRTVEHLETAEIRQVWPQRHSDSNGS